MSLSRMVKECRECKYKNSCQNKRMEALGYIGSNTMPTTAMNGMTSMATKPHDYRDIKITENTVVTIVFEDIKKRCFRINSSEVYK